MNDIDDFSKCNICCSLILKKKPYEKYLPSKIGNYEKYKFIESHILSER